MYQENIARRYILTKGMKYFKIVILIKSYISFPSSINISKYSTGEFQLLKIITICTILNAI